MNNLSIELLTVRANGGGLKELVDLVHDQVGGKHLEVLKKNGLIVDGKMIEIGDAQAYLRIETEDAQAYLNSL